MDRQQMEENLKEISQIFYEGQKLLQTLKEGIEQEGTSREILDKLLQQLWLESNWESRYAAYMRIADLKFEPLDIALKQAGKSQADRDRAFEISYEYTRSLAQKRQEAFLSEIQQRKLLPEFYQCFLESWHILWVAHAPLFLSWNKALLFETNRQLEAEFGSDEAVLEFLKTQKLFDTGREGKRAERSYSILQKKSWKWKSTSYAELFPKKSEKSSVFSEKLSKIYLLSKMKSTERKMHTCNIWGLFVMHLQKQIHQNYWSAGLK